MKFSVNTASESPSGCGSFAGKGVGTLFFGIFFLVGMLFVVLILGEALKQLEPWWWPEIPCAIVASSVEEGDDGESPYSAIVRYRYEFDGRSTKAPGSPARNAAPRAMIEHGPRPSDTPPVPRPPAASSPTIPSCRSSNDGCRGSFPGRLLPDDLRRHRRRRALVLWRSRPTTETARSSPSRNRPARAPANASLILLGSDLRRRGRRGLRLPLAVPSPGTRRGHGMGARRRAPLCARRVRSWSTDDGTSYRADVLYEYRCTAAAIGAPTASTSSRSLKQAAATRGPSATGIQRFDDHLLGRSGGSIEVGPRTRAPTPTPARPDSPGIRPRRCGAGQPGSKCSSAARRPRGARPWRRRLYPNVR